MTKKNKLKYIFIGIVLVMAALATADSLGVFNTKNYSAVSHGSHNHYVPEDRDPNVSIHSFPTEEPGPNERITRDGRVVPIE